MHVQECTTAKEVRALCKKVLDRKRARRITKKIPVNDLSPGSFPVPVERVVNVVFATIETISYPEIASIIEVVCRRYKTTRMALISERRAADIVLPRQIVCALARRLTPHSLPVIAKHLGGRDHTTILHSCQKIDSRRAADPAFDQELTELEAELGGVLAVPRVVKRDVPPSPWDRPEVGARLIALASATTLSESQIAAVLNAEFGTTLTKSACHGRLLRVKFRRPRLIDLIRAAA